MTISEDYHSATDPEWNWRDAAIIVVTMAVIGIGAWFIFGHGTSVHSQEAEAIASQCKVSTKAVTYDFHYVGGAHTDELGIKYLDPAEDRFNIGGGKYAEIMLPGTPDQAIACDTGLSDAFETGGEVHVEN